MRIFVAGATGAVGRRLVSRLVRAGHAMTGLTHTPSKAGFVRELRAEPVVADALDEKSIKAAAGAARPDVIVHELTDLAGVSDLRNFDRAFAGSNRLRTLGTDYLLAAAREYGARRMIVQSFCGWPYVRTGGYVKSEEDPLDPTRRASCVARSTRSAIWNASRCRGGDRPGRRAWQRGLQHRGRRSGACLRMASRGRKNPRREAAVSRPGLARTRRGRRTSRRYDDRITRRVKLQGEAGTRMASDSPFLAAGILRSPSARETTGRIGRRQ